MAFPPLLQDFVVKLASETTKIVASFWTRFADPHTPASPSLNPPGVSTLRKTVLPAVRTSKRRRSHLFKSILLIELSSFILTLWIFRFLKLLSLLGHFKFLRADPAIFSRLHRPVVTSRCLRSRSTSTNQLLELKSKLRTLPIKSKVPRNNENMHAMAIPMASRARTAELVGQSVLA